jgi:hypothetical protein
MQGFRDKYHKDEYHKLNKYWSNNHESGKYNKYGEHGEHYHKHDDKHEKGGKHAVSIFIPAPLIEVYLILILDALLPY